MSADQLAFVLELDFSRDRGKRGVDVGDTRDDVALTGLNRPALGVRHHVLEDGDRHALRDPGALVDALVVPRLERDALDDFGDEIRNPDLTGAARRPRFLIRDRHSELDALGIVRHHLAPDAVLERRDDLAAGGIVLGIGGEAKHDIQRQSHRISFDLDIAFLHDVEQAHLHLSRQVGQLVQGENAPVCAREHSIVHRELVAEYVSAARGLDGIQIADDVGDGDVRRRQLLDVAHVGIEPRDRRVVAGFLHKVLPVLGDRRERIVVYLAAGDDRKRWIEQRGERAENSRFRLSAEPQQDEVVPAEKSVDDLRHDRLFIADYAVEDRLPARQASQKIAAKLILDRQLPSVGSTEGGAL